MQERRRLELLRRGFIRVGHLRQAAAVKRLTSCIEVRRLGTRYFLLTNEATKKVCTG